MVSAPVNTVKTIQMCDPHGISAVAAMKRVMQKGGIPALFAGLAPSVYRCVIPALTMFTLLPILRVYCERLLLFFGPVATEKDSIL